VKIENFKKLDTFFDYNQLNNIKVNFDKKEIFIRLSCYGNNKSKKFSQCYNNLKEISENFKVNFSIESKDSLCDLMRLKDAVYIEKYLVELSLKHEIFFHNWYSVKNENNAPVKIDIKKEILEAKKINKINKRVKKFRNDLFNHAILSLPRNKEILKEILTDFDFNNNNLYNIVKKLEHYPESCKKAVKFLLDNKSKFKINHSSTISENYNFKNLEQCNFVENFYIIPKNNKSYNRLKNLSIFGALDTQDDNLKSEVI
jgi:hypothetical protein